MKRFLTLLLIVFILAVSVVPIGYGFSLWDEKIAWRFHGWRGQGPPPRDLVP